jgi:hypothetical protein
MIADVYDCHKGFLDSVPASSTGRSLSAVAFEWCGKAGAFVVVVFVAWAFFHFGQAIPNHK